MSDDEADTSVQTLEFCSWRAAFFLSYKPCFMGVSEWRICASEDILIFLKFNLLIGLRNVVVAPNLILFGFNWKGKVV